MSPIAKLLWSLITIAIAAALKGYLLAYLLNRGEVVAGRALSAVGPVQRSECLLYVEWFADPRQMSLSTGILQPLSTMRSVGLGEWSFLPLEFSVEYLIEYSSTRQGK